MVRSSEEYGWYGNPYSFLVLGKVKIWGEVVEHERRYRSEFARIVSLDYGDPELLATFRAVRDDLPRSPEAALGNRRGDTVVSPFSSKVAIRRPDRAPQETWVSSGSPSSR